MVHKMPLLPHHQRKIRSLKLLNQTSPERPIRAANLAPRVELKVMRKQKKHQLSEDE
jgi:hypothetical protein